MKNAPFFALVGVVAVVVSLLVIGLFLQVTQGGLPPNAVGGVCTIAFLGAAIIAYELIAKPGLYTRRKTEEEAIEEKEEEEPESPQT